jgi:non-ribosomal peptide synthetase component F
VFPFDVPREGVDRVAGWLRNERITIYHSVPSVFRCVAASGEGFPSIRLIRLEGDQASVKDVALFQSRFKPPCILVNGLGATECGIVRQYFIGPETFVPEGVLPIGDPVEDMDVVLLDESGGAMEPGHVGEIAVRSRYLAPGYWGRPELTAAAFTEDPRDASRRIYRTGDLGRFRPDDCLEHLGRTDFQVKIRGNRVEGAEVEAALLAIGTLREVAVVTRDDLAEPRLVAYVVPGSGSPPV